MSAMDKEDREDKENVPASKPNSTSSVSPKDKDKDKGKAKVARTKEDDEYYPLITFRTASSASTSSAPASPPLPQTSTLLVGRTEFRLEDPSGALLARRVQLPLDLAWAMSIHKAQGQTVERLRVDLRGAFECGQCYVALSRAVGAGGLQVVGFEGARVRAHWKVLRWSEELEKEMAASANPSASTSESAEMDI